MARPGLSVDRLTRAAADLADEVGFGGLTVSALARGFGVKDTNLYAHIKNVQDLKSRVAVLALRELADRVALELAGRAGKDALVAFAGAYRAYAKEHPGRYEATRFKLDPGEAAAEAAGRHAAMTRALLRAYDLPEAEQTHAVRLLHSTLFGYVTLETTEAFRDAPGLDASWERILDALDSVLRNWPSP